MEAFVGKGNGSEEAAPAATPDPIGELRRLLLVPEHSQVERLQERLDDPEIHAEDVSRVLPEAIALRATKDRALTRAMLPTVEEAILSSVRKDPHVLVDALFPVMGPAIRKAISSALASMIESLNDTLEKSFSVQGLKWRWEAWRTGKPLSEIILLRTLVYRVEQVFLIHRKTGLLLQHVSATSGGVQDADMVSGMLTAIRDFVQDSFGGNRDDSLDSFKVGEFTVRIEQGPEAVLAAVVRGTAPPELRSTLAGAIEAIHLEQAEALADFEGDATPFERSRAHLEACLRRQQLTRAERRSGGRSRTAIAFLKGAFAVLLIGIAVWSFFAIRRSGRWNAYLERLAGEPGIAVIASGRSGGRYFVRGLRDPLAADPVALLAESKIARESVSSDWKPYQALVPEFIVARAREVLEPPRTVTLTASGGKVVATGSAPHRWIEEARARSRAFAGLARYDDARLTDDDGRELEALAKAIEGRPISFDLASAQLRPEQSERLATLSRDLSRIAQLAAAAGRTVRVEVIGRGDSSGTPEANMAVSRLRAERVARELSSTRDGAVTLTARGVGSSQPLRPEIDERDRELNRSVTLRVVLEGSPGRSDTR
ncbi:MAG TPA: OmpA family protein [Thermoanaerobaculia bacterium]|nr:OmpA family protein [Thermoanaerobaculia bacterium]